MELANYITGFMNMVGGDPRIGPHHISLFLAVLHYYHQQGGCNPVLAFSRELRKQAKIGSIRSYYSCMKDLKEWGYLEYNPSFDPAKASSFYLVTL